MLTRPPSPAVVPKSHPNSVPSTPDSIEYAGFWLRFWAGAIDLCLEFGAAVLLTGAIYFILDRYRHLLGLSSYDFKFAAGYAFVPLLAVGSWLYCAFTESSSWHATIGKRALGLQVITTEGGRTSFGQATVRHFMKFLSFFCLTIGFMMAGWTRRRQALHDMPCDCVVVRVPVKGFSLLGS
ncbi:MAG TPA: RDD family protein [Terriglobales bacterium]|nr:RDD family protein [Terriglobales bacterium]